MTTSLRIGTGSLSRRYKEQYITNLSVNERRKMQREAEAERIIDQRKQNMQESRDRHKADVYATQGNKSFLVKG